MPGASKSKLRAGDSTPPLQAQTSAGSAPARAPSIALEKRVAFTGLTVELFEDVEEVNLTLSWTAVFSPGMWRPLSVHKSARETVGALTWQAWSFWVYWPKGDVTLSD